MQSQSQKILTRDENPSRPGFRYTSENPSIYARDATAPDPACSGVAPHRIYTIGNEQPVELLRYIEVLEECLGKKAVMEMPHLQAGDVPGTEADVSDLIANVGYRPVVPLEEGVAKFVEWYRDYYRVWELRD